MRFRKPRIAWSVVCGIACVLLLMLWVRSYWWSDGVRIPHPPSELAQLKSYKCSLHYYDGHYSGKPVNGWRFFSRRDRPVELHLATPIFGEWLFDAAGPIRVSVPHWLFILVCATLATAPWVRSLPSHFSLRTLLFATTLVAVVLGLIVAVL